MLGVPQAWGKGQGESYTLFQTLPSAQCGFSDFWTSRTCLTSPTRPRANTDSCSFAPFVNIRGLKTSIEFPLFPSHEAHKAVHERERANNFPLSRANTIRLLADSLIASADSIRKPADTIRKMTKRIRTIFIKNGLKSTKIPQNLHFPQDFARFFPPAKSKILRKFWQKAKRRAFLNFSEEGLLSILRKVLEVVGLVGLVGPVGKVVERTAYRTSPTSPTNPIRYRTSPRVAAEHSPLWGRWRGLSPFSSPFSLHLKKILIFAANTKHKKHHTMEMVSVFMTFGIIVALSIFFYFVPFFLWLSAKVSGVHISLIQLFLMRIRNVPPGIIVPSMIEAHKAGLQNITRDKLEAHYMTGGHVQRVVHALVSANKANIDLTFEKATAIDLAGRDVFEAVQTSVNPKVIDTPPVAAVAKNGIQLIAKARVTVRANIQQLVGGAGEETILARVGEGIVSSIGSAESHETVLENPDSISKLVLRKGLDAGTAFEILSIDIADIDVGKNIGATLQMDQANADKNIAQAKAEERRAMAVATEQEMKAKAQEARAEVIRAEAQVPLALAKALNDGNMGAMDYYRLKNLLGDTEMREEIAGLAKNGLSSFGQGNTPPPAPKRRD